jgi:hypothetical protein
MTSRPVAAEPKSPSIGAFVRAFCRCLTSSFRRQNNQLTRICHVQRSELPERAAKGLIKGECTTTESASWQLLGIGCWKLGASFVSSRNGALEPQSRRKRRRCCCESGKIEPHSCRGLQGPLVVEEGRRESTGRGVKARCAHISSRCRLALSLRRSAVSSATGTATNRLTLAPSPWGYPSRLVSTLDAVCAAPVRASP